MLQNTEWCVKHFQTCDCWRRYFKYLSIVQKPKLQAFTMQKVLPNQFWSIITKFLLSFLIFAHCCMFCVDISCYYSIRWKIIFLIIFDYKVSENHKVTNYQNCSVTNCLCTTVTQIIQELQNYRIPKNYNVTDCVKTAVSNSVRTIVSNYQNHTENYNVMNYEIYSVTNYEKYNVTKYLRAVISRIIWKLKCYELSELQCHIW